MTQAIEVTGLRKRYRDSEALCGVDLAVPAGTVLGLLGPNGAGKTTTVRVLATLLRPDAGTAKVAGFDVVRSPREVRARIGLAGQYAAVDELLTGAENLVLLGRLLHLGGRGARRRAAELLEQFGLTGAANRPVRTYSGGMRRRLDIASCLVVTPEVLFLDEPTTGLDPASRIELWATVRELVRGGVTLLLTTQYLEEADQLADRVAVIAGGRVIADGTPDELKRKVGGERLEVAVEPRDVPVALAALARFAAEPPVAGEGGRISLKLAGTLDGIASAAAALRSAGVDVTDFALRRPSLDDVFLDLIGRRASG
ncbi:ABC-2 type transport system ATP-binding protein [Lentzea albidocapillata subsp. violacea]|uniref:ABC-2 type transport system ATP-binding protein n=1 Tax=Lentzea albidocapillata subsp. violacea TaxID=128104 RepID=A0A1G9JI48_9PSEU|nr:ATP-binding cassette domain-containing protein [Lentzea albidocapillata]SDL36925.1 ABC-2 type transport system ATP-binding protein [Lentzea albidocapillata subsp. violacea]